MLHKIEIPAYRPQLEAILQFQYELLSFACSVPTLPLNPAMLKDNFGELCGGWLSKRCWKDNAGKHKNIFCVELEDLISYMAQNPLKGPEIVDAFQNDKDFHNLHDPDFEFQYPKLSQNTKEVLAPLMIAFYKRLLETGFPSCVHLGSTTKFDRKLLLRGFYTANPNLKVCPGCDGPQPRLSNQTLGIPLEEEAEAPKRRDFAEIDHFFPKSSYPFFSIHFMNLVPLCPTCNIKAKNGKDPLNAYTGKGALQHTFIPFIKPAISCIEIVIDRDTNSRRRVMLKDIQLPASQRMRNLDITFELSMNWEHHLDRWIGHMVSQIRRSLPRSKKNCQRIEKEIKKILRNLKMAHKDEIGQIDYLLVQRGYAKYALDNPLELELLIEQAMDNNAPKRNNTRK